MGRRYKQLSAKERVKIYHWHANGKSARWIGEALGRQASTITRELSRNGKNTERWRSGYEPVRAHSLALRRRRWDCRFKLVRQPELRRLVRDKLAMGWSPEQIAAWLTQAHPSMTISHEAIYRYIYHRGDKKQPWHHFLARRKYQRGKYGKRGGSVASLIKDRVSIEERPKYIAKRRQFGHWEADCLLFSRTGQAILVMQERTSRCIALKRQPSMRAEDMAATLKGWFAAMPQPMRRTLTQDNGGEFAHHYKLRDDLGIKTYFCAPHSPWQKGGIENMNGRLRRFLPRSTDLDTLSPQALSAIADRANNTPRKCLGFKTPAAVFSALKSAVALQT